MEKIYLNNPPDDWRSKIEEFFKSIELEFEWAGSQDDADVSIDFPEEHEVSSKKLLHVKGRISCPVAFMAADNLGISRTNFGKMANELNIRIFGCQLGCFK